MNAAKNAKVQCCEISFLAKDETCQIYWRKYEAKSMGSGQNLLYFNGHKYKLTDWLALDTASRRDLLENTGF